MKKKILFLLSSIILFVFCFLGINNNSKTAITNIISDLKAGSYNVSTFDHIDIQSAASFTYYVDGNPVTVNINFYENNTNLSKINIYKKNKDGTLTKIPVSGKWQNVSGWGGNDSNNKEYRISGKFDRYYDSSQKEEIVYVVKYTLSVTINGENQELVYTEDYSYSSSNNVCPGTANYNKGIDVKITGTKLESYFSSTVKIIKNVENASDNTFTFEVKAVNNNIDFKREVTVTTKDNTGFITLGGLKPGEKYTVTEIRIPEGYELVGNNSVEVTAESNKTKSITFTNRAKTIDISGKKIWNDNNNQDGIRPDSVTVNLLKNDKVINTTTATKDNNWNYSFNDLPEYENGKKIIYKVEEESVIGYTSKVEGYNITNTHKIEKTTISGTKIWNDNDNQDGIRPKFITVNLIKDGKVIKTTNAVAETDWKYEFTDLDKYENGNEIEYTVEEESVKGYTSKVEGYNITNTHEVEKIKVSGAKIWNDNDNQDGIRPDSITVKLYANDEYVASMEVTEKTDWKYEFTNLDKYKNGKEIEYTVEEVEVDGYTSKIDGFDITNTHKIEKTKVSGTKIWNDNDNQDGIRPDSIIVKLYANDEYVASMEVTEENDWKYEFTDLDKFEAGKEITYTVSEDEVEGYTSKVDGFDITNTHKIEKTKVSGTKTWEDKDNQDGIRPTKIIVKLYANGKEISLKEVTEKTNWKYEFTNLDKFKNGKEIEYTVEEVSVEGYTSKVEGFNIINTHKVEKTKVSGTKTWEDNDNQDGIRPGSITVKLYANGEYVASKEVTKETDWKYEFTNLDKFKDGKEIEYIVEEVGVEGYTSKVEGFDITNTHEVKKIEVSGTKTWEDNNNQDGVRPDSITVRLYANGKEISSKEVTEEDNWSYTFNNLDENEKGSKIEYTIKEDDVKGYSKVIDGYNITNTHEVEKTTVSGTKTWKDNNNQDGKRPTSITVYLLKNSKKIDSIEVTKENNWSYKFSNLDKFENGEEIEYTVEEESVEGYTSKVDGFDITNTHEIEKTTVSGTKIWNDNNDQDGIRTNSITVKLYANDKYVSSKEVTEENDWVYEFTNLDKYANGEEIVYTVKEVAVDGYTSTVDGFDIINTHEIEKTTVSGSKIWDDNNNQDGIRSDSITVKLYADGEYVDSKEVTNKTDWKYEFTNLDKYKDGSEIKYTISEDKVEGYETIINGYNITNTHIPETTKVVGQKIWNDNNNQDGLRPDSITVRLYADGKEVNSLDVTKGENNEWIYAFINLPKYKEGKLINYTVSEDEVEEYQTTYSEENPYVIINTHQTKKIDVSGIKTWDDNDNQDGIRPGSITVRLYADGNEIDSLEVTEETNWEYKFTNLDMYKEGKLISYTITEDAIEGYSTIIDNYNIINTHTPEKINITGTKTWDDNNNQDGKRPEFIIVNLLKGEEVLDSVVVTEENSWKYEFSNLDKYANGEEIVYTLTEEVVNEYETIVDGFNITNIHEIEKITFKATKIWEDNDNQDGIRQKEVNVKLYKNGNLLEEVKITEENNWAYIFSNLDRYENGEEVIYTIVEDVVLGYEAVINYEDIDENNIVSATIINTHTPEQISIDINKTWNDNNDKDGLRPNSIDVELYADGEYIKTISITNNDNWKYSIIGLDKFKNGNEINYSIIELPVKGYATSYDKFNIINNIDLGKGGDVELLPPQTGIIEEKSNYSYSLITLLLASLLVLIKKFI